MRHVDGERAENDGATGALIIGERASRFNRGYLRRTSFRVSVVPLDSMRAK